MDDNRTAAISSADDSTEVQVAENSLTEISPKKLAELIIQILESKKAQNIKLLYVEKQTVLADYFVICTGTSNTQIRALSDAVREKLGQGGLTALRVEGERPGNWILLDYASVIVHIFNREMRDFYKLEKLWQDASETDISSLLKED